MEWHELVRPWAGSERWRERPGSERDESLCGRLLPVSRSNERNRTRCGVLEWDKLEHDAGWTLVCNRCRAVWPRRMCRRWRDEQQWRLWLFCDPSRRHQSQHPGLYYQWRLYI